MCTGVKVILGCAFPHQVLKLFGFYNCVGVKCARVHGLPLHGYRINESTAGADASVEASYNVASKKKPGDRSSDS